ncbi:hypothetical protein GQ53DRAFT_9950 [Thozetella sp. PMI_491]|nr:hypothetical protein GQ53DRAFT_9950 [Thozetella sp. PMI_491]
MEKRMVVEAGSGRGEAWIRILLLIFAELLFISCHNHQSNLGIPDLIQPWITVTCLDGYRKKSAKHDAITPRISAPCYRRTKPRHLVG